MVISTVNQVTYNGDGINTAWPFTFQTIDKTDVKVMLIYENGTRVEINSDYYVDAVNNTVYYPGYAPGAEPPEEDQPPKVQEGQKLMLYRQLPLTQEADLGESWPFYVIEKALDKLTMLVQDVYGWYNRNVMTYKEGTLAWNADHYRIADVENPIDQQDAATKDYVDSLVAGIVAEGNDVIAVDTIAVLRTTDLQAGMFAGVAGQYNVFDGNGAAYAIRSAGLSDVDDGYNIIILDNGNVAQRLIPKSEIADKLVDDIDLYRAPFVSMRKWDSFFATQGMCVAGDYLIVSVYKGDTDADINRLYSIDIENKSVASYTETVTNHANGMFYDADNKLVCVTGNFTGANTIRRFSIDMTDGSMTLYDSISAPAGVYWFGGGWNKGKYYLFSTNVVYITTDFATYETLTYPTDLVIHTDMAIQGGCVDDNFLYICFSGNDHIERIYIYDKDNGNLVKVLSCQRGHFGELEDIDVYNGNLFINFNRPYRDSMLGTYMIPLYKDTQPMVEGSASNPLVSQDGNITEFFVDTGYDIAFPDGTQDKPFNCVGCAETMALLSNGVVEIRRQDLNYDLRELYNQGTARYRFITSVAGTLRIAAPNDSTGFTALISINSANLISDNGSYLVQGYGAGGSTRILISKLFTQGGASISVTEDADANAVNVSLPAFTYVTVHLMGGISDLWNSAEPLNVTFTE